MGVKLNNYFATPITNIPGENTVLITHFESVFMLLEYITVLWVYPFSTLRCIDALMYLLLMKFTHVTNSIYSKLTWLLFLCLAVLEAKKRPNEDFEEVPSAKRKSESYNEGLNQL